MLTLATTLLSIAVALGCGLALWHLAAGERRRSPPRLLGALHGLLGAGGLAALLVLLQGPPRGEAMGVGGFGVAGAVLFGAALVVGLAILALLRRSRTGAAAAIVVHASLAITGFVLFLAWVSIG